MRKAFMTLLTVFLFYAPVRAADKVRISIPGLASIFMTFPLAYKKGFLKEEGVEAEIIRISSAGGWVQPGRGITAPSLAGRRRITPLTGNRQSVGPA